jgi:hypothetical protein
MSGSNNDQDDFQLDSIFEDDAELDDVFKEEGEHQTINDELSEELKEEFTIDEESHTDSTETVVEETPAVARKKRSFLDFEPDMDAILLTAQSPMIIEGIKCYSKKQFSAKTMNIYVEASKGAELYIKILDRNPDNYHKLKVLIDQDIDCQEVEKTAFNIYLKVHGVSPENDKEKLEAFEMLHKLFNEAINKASISKSMITIKQYFLLSGGLDEAKLQSLSESDNVEFKAIINSLNHQVNIATNMLKKGKIEIAQGLKGKDLNIFVIKSSQLLSFYYKLIGNEQLTEYYMRINDLYKKYFVIRE